MSEETKSALKCVKHVEVVIAVDTYEDGSINYYFRGGQDMPQHEFYGLISQAECLARVSIIESYRLTKQNDSKREKSR